MDYLQASKRFDLDKFISKISSLDFFELLKELNNETIQVEKISIPQRAEYRRDIEFLKYEYISDIKKFAYLLNFGVKPAGADKRLLNKFITVINNLIEKGQLNNEVLELFE